MQVAGTSGKVVIDGGSDDEGASTEAHGRAIVAILGAERRNEVLAAVYMVRSDVSLAVRQVNGSTLHSCFHSSSSFLNLTILCTVFDCRHPFMSGRRWLQTHQKH